MEVGLGVFSCIGLLEGCNIIGHVVDVMGKAFRNVTNVIVLSGLWVVSCGNHRAFLKKTRKDEVPVTCITTSTLDMYIPNRNKM